MPPLAVVNRPLGESVAFATLRLELPRPLPSLLSHG